MGIEGAILAYRDSLEDAAVYDTERRIGARSWPIIGGLLSAIKLFANAVWRPFKIMGGLIFGHSPDHDIPDMPAIPEKFKGTELDSALTESWKLKQEEIHERIDGIGKFLKLDIEGWWQAESVAEYDETKEKRVVFPNEGHDQDVEDRDVAISNATGKPARTSPGFLKSLLQSRNDGIERAP